MSLILASNSRYKRAQMQKLGLIFTSAAPENEEKHDTKISPRELSLILAKQKALEIRPTP